MAKTVEQQIAELRDEIREHDRRYYVENAPTISDREYDKRLALLKELEAAHPEHVTPDSPTQRVGGEPIEGFRTVAHARPMFSIDNTYDAADLRKWAARCYEATDPTLLAIARELEDSRKGSSKAAVVKRRIISEKYDAALAEADRAGYPIAGGYIADPKVDGVAINLRYERGLLVLAVTRGDGQRGDDVTQNVRMIRSIPLSLHQHKTNPIPQILEVRGEIYMPLDEFERMNRAVVKAGEEPFANPRNATFGTLKQHDPNVVKNRHLRIVAHGRGEIIDKPRPLFNQTLDGTTEAFPTHSEFLKALAVWGIPTNRMTEQCDTIDSVWKTIEGFAVKRNTLSYLIDGVVVRVDRINLQEQLGYTSKSPRWCIAYKYAAEQAETTILKVDWQVGKTGKLTPRATMEPVLLAGTTVKHATLHNLGEIRRKDIRLGDCVVIQKAGEIIPQVMRVITEKRGKNVRPISPPEICPVCSGDVQIDFDSANEAEETSRYCINPECPAQFRERVIYFAGRNQMNIEGLGEEIIDQLLNARLITHLADLYTLNEEQLASLVHKSVTRKGKEVDVRLGETKARQILDSLKTSKERGLARVLSAINIRHIGLQTARVIASKVKDIDQLLSSDEEFVRSTVWETKNTSRLINVKKAASLFHTALHSVDGMNRVKEAKIVAGENPSVNEMMVFLQNLPEGSKWGRVKWGNKDEPGSGRGKKDRILQRFSTLDELCSSHVEELIDLFDDEVVGRSLYEFLHSERGRDTIARLRAVGLDLSSHQVDKASVDGALAGKVFVVTGTLQNYSREDAHELIRSHGGKPTSSVSTATDYLVVGENPGSKVEKANNLGVAIISEAEFSKLIGDDMTQ